MLAHKNTRTGGLLKRHRLDRVHLLVSGATVSAEQTAAERYTRIVTKASVEHAQLEYERAYGEHDEVLLAL